MFVGLYIFVSSNEWLELIHNKLILSFPNKQNYIGVPSFRSDLSVPRRNDIFVKSAGNNKREYKFIFTYYSYNKNRKKFNFTTKNPGSIFFKIIENNPLNIKNWLAVNVRNLMKTLSLTIWIYYRIFSVTVTPC